MVYVPPQQNPQGPGEGLGWGSRGFNVEHVFGTSPGYGFLDPYGNAIRGGTEAAYDPYTWTQPFTNLEGAMQRATAVQQRGDAAANDSLGMLRSAAMGQQPSVAQIQMQGGMEQAMRQQMAMANSQRGGNVGANFRQTQQAGLGAQLQNNQQMGALRAQEMATARGQYSQAAGGMQALLQNRANNYIQLGYSMDQAVAQARQDAARLQAEIALGQMQADTATRSQNLQLIAATASALGSGGANLATT